MDKQILRILRKNNVKKAWKDVYAKIKSSGNPATKIAIVNNESAYCFFDTYSDDLSLNSSSITISVQPVESFIPYHMHNYVEIMIPLVEDCIVELEHTKVRVRQENIIFVGNKTIHKVFPISKKGIVINIALRSSAFSLNELDFLQSKDNDSSISNLLFSLLSDEEYGEGRYSLFETEHDSKIINLIYDIINEYYFPQVQSDQVIRLEMLTLFSRLIRKTYYRDTQITDYKQESNNLLSLLLYIEKNYPNVTLKKMANHFGFNPNYLSNYLKNSTGLSFIKLVQLQRINVAARYLTYTKVSIEKIANEVGYENPSYFYKVFKQYFGTPPAKYRLNSRKISHTV